MTAIQRPVTPRDVEDYRREIAPFVDQKVKIMSMFGRPSYVINLSSGIGHMELDIPDEVRLLLAQMDELIALVGQRYGLAPELVIEKG